MFVCTTLFPPTPTPLHLPHLALGFFRCVCVHACMFVCVCVCVFKSHQRSLFFGILAWFCCKAAQHPHLRGTGNRIVCCCCCCLTCWYIAMNTVCASPSPPPALFHFWLSCFRTMSRPPSLLPWVALKTQGLTGMLRVVRIDPLSPRPGPGSTPVLRTSPSIASSASTDAWWSLIQKAFRGGTSASNLAPDDLRAMTMITSLKKPTVHRGRPERWKLCHCALMEVGGM